jgi:peptidoglycan LD-endopeptidase LytH
VRRRRLSILIVCAAVAVGVYNNTRDLPAMQRFWKQVALPWRVLRITARPADTTLVMPVESARVAAVANTWHAARSNSRRHEGQDIFAPRATPVYSATEGIVVRVGQNRLGGNVVLVVGGGGRTYYYAHLDAYAPGLDVGDIVSTDSVLGYVGTTGNARGTPPHLHFGVYSASGAIDPLPLLIDRIKQP